MWQTVWVTRSESENEEMGDVEVWRWFDKCNKKDQVVFGDSMYARV